MTATAEQIESTETGLAIPEITKEQWPAIYDAGDYLQELIDKVRAEVTGEVPDLSTKKGRDRVASLARKVATTKKAVENPGREYLKHIKAKVKPIETNIREFVIAMDLLRDEVRKPLTDWEQAEKARVDNHKGRIADIQSIAGDHIHTANSEKLRELQADLELFDPATFEEFEGAAAAALIATQKILREALDRRVAFEDEQARLEKQRQEQEAEQRRLDEERIRQEAAEKARKDAEAKAQAEREAARRREVEAKLAQERAEREKIEAEARAKRAEEEAAAKAEQAARDAEARVKREAEEKASAEAAEAQRRQEDQEHRATINRAIKAALIEAGLSDDDAKSVVIALVKGEIPHVSVRY